MSNVRVRDTEGAHGPNQRIRRPRCGAAAERRDDAHGHYARMSDTEGETVMDNQEVIFAEQDVDTVPPANGSTAVATRTEAPAAVPVQASTGVMTPMQMLNAAIERGANMDVLEKLMTLHERWEANQARKAFDEAMASAKAEIPPIFKNRTVDFTSTKGRTHYKHEDLAEIARTVNPILGKYGLSYRFRTSAEVNQPVCVTCIVSHRLGYYEENTLHGPRDESGNKNSIQAIGSTLTYLQRMTLKAALGLAATDDDDGRRTEMKDGEPDPLATITEEQQAEIKELLEATNSDVGKFLEFAKAEFVGDILAKDFPKLKAILLKKKSEAR